MQKDMYFNIKDAIQLSVSIITIGQYFEKADRARDDKRILRLAQINSSAQAITFKSPKSLVILVTELISEDIQGMISDFSRVRKTTMDLFRSLSIEDSVVQSQLFIKGK